MKKYYAEIAIMGMDHTEKVSFESKTERDEFVRTTDYTGKITSKEAIGAEPYPIFKARQAY